jgi:hypothetical protein
MNFCAGLKEEFPHISSAAVKNLLPFPLCNCVKQLSRYEATKSRYRKRLNAERNMRIQLSKVAPDFKACVTSKQFHLPCFVNTKIWGGFKLAFSIWDLNLKYVLTTY